MPPRQRVPSDRLHKASGQARRPHPGTPLQSGHARLRRREKYARLIAEHFAPAAEVRAEPQPARAQFPELCIDELLLAYLQFASGYYSKDGRPTKELTCMKEAMRHLRVLYASLPAREFGPLKLKAVRTHMIEACDLSRGVVNQRVNRIKRIFKWAVSEELVAPSVYEGLRTVAGLRYGRSTARETEPIKPVPDAFVDATLPHVSPQVAAMVELQRFTGMRPCEVVTMRPCDVDTNSEIWIYELADPKNRGADTGDSYRSVRGPKRSSDSFSHEGPMRTSSARARLRNNGTPNVVATASRR